MNEAAQILVRTDVDLKTFREEIQPANRPVLLKGLVKHWGIVQAANESPRALADYLRRFDRGRTPNTIELPAAAKGRLFYREDMSGLNFTRYVAPISVTLDRLLSLAGQADPPTVFIESMIAADFMPDFAAAHPMPLVDPQYGPRLWIGNRVTVQTHYDISQNIACVVAGRRRFTLFPPEQLVNLYVGPLEFTLAGQPISMVRLEQPDLERFPRFREAQATMQAAELEPGDALFVPYMWWHHVESREKFNVLVNYWWSEVPLWQGSPFEALLHAIMSVKSLPPGKRAIWRKVFEHYIFQEGGDPVAHLTARQQGIQGPASPQIADLIRRQLVHLLSNRRR